MPICPILTGPVTNAVNIYDSLYDSVDEKSLKIIQQLFGVKEVRVVPVQKQQGFNDCGLFAIAYAVYLAKKQQKNMIQKRLTFTNHR